MYLWLALGGVGFPLVCPRASRGPFCFSTLLPTALVLRSLCLCVCVCMKAMKRGLDCASLDCLQSEPASEVMRVQESIMGVPRSVGDFFT